MTKQFTLSVVLFCLVAVLTIGCTSAPGAPTDNLASSSMITVSTCPGAAAVIEGLIDDLLWQVGGRKL